MMSRWTLPENPLRASFIATQLVALAALVGSARALGTALHFGASYPLNACLVFAVVMLVALGFMGASHPFARFGLANQITTVRAMIVALVAGLIAEPASPAAASVAVGAAFIVTLLDGADGWLARRDRMASVFGARFDLEIDALLILALSILAWRYGKAGSWIIASGLLRYLFVATGAAVGWLKAPLPPSRRRQTICVTEVVGLMLVVAPVITPPASVALAAVALALLCYSFLVDTVWLWRRHETSLAAPGGAGRGAALSQRVADV